MALSPPTRQDPDPRVRTPQRRGSHKGWDYQETSGIKRMGTGQGNTPYNEAPMNMKKIALAFIPILLLAIILVMVANPDKPRNGEWDFRLQKAWEVDRAGDEVLGFPFSLMATDKGNLYVFDAANNANYIFDKDGQFLRAFARRGQGPGEVMGQDKIHYVDGKVYIPAMSAIHVFTGDGDYIETVKLEGGSLYPRVFLNGDEIISAPLTAAFLQDGRGEIIRKNIRTGEEAVLAEFSLQDWGIAQSGDSVVDMVAIGFSPLMVVGYADDRLYWGMNTAYRINVTDLGGRKVRSFSLKRRARKVTDKFKKDFFTSADLPAETLDQIAESFPNKISYFHRIEVHDGLVYVFVPDVDLESKRAKLKQIDIFSPEGEYLYRAQIRFEEGRHPLFSPLNNLVIQDGHLYAVLMDDEDNVHIAQYEIALPDGN
jgi:hypothetical protein